MRGRCPIRRGTAAVEFAIVGSATFTILIGLFVGSAGVFNFQQVANLARQASRWASVHGTQYATTTGNTAATATDVYNNAIAPNAAGLNLSKVTYSVTWNTSNSPSHTATVNGAQVNVANTVTVIVNYQWVPVAYLSAMTLSSTSTSVMSN
jgi:Flp pilus assembly protein TadG